MNEFYSKIAGVTAKNPDGSDRQKYIKAYAKANMPLILRREPDNKYDPHAIAVYIKVRVFIFLSDIIQIGYLNTEVAAELTKHISKGGSISGRISQVTGSASTKSLGVNILLTKQDD